MAAKSRFNQPLYPNAKATVAKSDIQAKKTTTYKKNTSSGDKKNSLNIFYVILVWAYAWFAFIPHLGAWDTNATHFLILSAFNLVIYSYMFTTDTFKNNQYFRWVFFKNPVGLSYAVYIFFMFLSLAKIVNFGEAVITCSKYFTTFTTAIILSMLISLDKRYLSHLAQAMTLVLLYDVFVLLNEVNKYISMKITGIDQIKSNYSNKNIFSSAILVKIPFALWLYLRDKSFWKKIGLAASFGAFLSIWFLSARASYLGIFFLFVILAGYLLYVQIRSTRRNWRNYWSYVIPLAVSIALSLFVFTMTKNYLYPKNDDKFNVNVADRLASIDVKNLSNDGSINLRLTSWKNSWRLFKDGPMLGAGIGNWKVKVLKYENETNGSFTYMYKAHNDFVETFTELGVFGGLAFVGIFVLIGVNFFRNHKSEGDEEDADLQFNNSALFLGLFGAAAYSVDAFFNFPADRPAMQIILGSFVAISIVYSSNLFIVKQPNDFVNTKLHRYSKPLIYVISCILVLGTWILWINYQSSKIQWIIAQDSAQPKPKLTGEELERRIPKIPDMTVVEEPMAVVKGRYYVTENNYRKALNVLNGDASSPWDGRVEYLSAFCHFKLNNLDSALYYAKKSAKVKPLFWGSIGLMSDLLVMKNDFPAALKVVRNYLTKMPSDKQAWLNAASLYERSGDKKSATLMIDSAIKNTGQDSSLLQLKQSVNNRRITPKNQNSFNLAAMSYNKKDYSAAINHFTQFLSDESSLESVLRAREFRGYSYFYTQQYEKALADFDFVKQHIKDKVNLNVMYQMCLSNLGKKGKSPMFNLNNLGKTGGQQDIPPQLLEALKKAQQQVSPEQLEALKREQREHQEQIDKQKQSPTGN